MPIKKYNSDNIETIKFQVSESSHPQVFGALVKELIECSGFSEDDAQQAISQNTFELELYNSESGLFAIDPGQVESCTTWDPYTGKEMEENNE